MKEKDSKSEERCCGSCCWFCYEETDGWGKCMCQDECDLMHCSDLCTTDEYVSREEMRHHMAVLLQESRYLNDSHCISRYWRPSLKDMQEATAFAYRYMKMFSKL